jgi:hypothetical protein
VSGNLLKFLQYFFAKVAAGGALYALYTRQIGLTLYVVFVQLRQSNFFAQS